MKVIRNILKIIEYRNMKLSIWLHGVGGGGGCGNRNNNYDNIIIINITILIIIILITLCRVFTIVLMKERVSIVYNIRDIIIIIIIMSTKMFYFEKI